ncbi:MAG: acyl-CoA thioesterase [Leptospiraceae bacterium]|nr:acyl-CoA thioesterase [Leptospiraceae bacterium]
MPSIDIPIPEKPHFQTEMKTRHYDTRSALTASGAHVTHLTYENIVLLANEGFDLFLENFGFSKANITGSNITVPSLEVTYHKEIKGNETLILEVSVLEIGNKSCQLIVIIKNKSLEVAAKARISLIFFNYKEMKTEVVPESFKKLFT